MASQRARALKEAVRQFLRMRGVEVSNYRWTIQSRRQRLFDYYGIDCLVDVGANTGQYASAVRRAGYGGRLVSVEPLASAFDKLARAARRDDLWHVLHAAVGSSSGTLSLNVSQNDVFSSALPLATEGLALGEMRYVSTENVEMLTLDTILESFTFESLAIKIDVQGFEEAVIEGASGALSRCQLVEVELSPTPIYEGQTLMVEIIRRLAEHGLELGLVENLLADPVSMRSLQFNGIFVRPMT